MKSIARRRFLKNSLLGAAAVSLPAERLAPMQLTVLSAPAADSARSPGIIDTNVNLFDWPFRALKYRDTKALVAKLKRHRVIQAWAGSYEALFAKDMGGVNERLAAECRARGRGFLIPFGSVNLAWPDWEEDVRRCHEVHRMPGLRIYPGYQPFDLDHPDLARLVKLIAERGLALQVVFGMEDPRVHHPIIRVGPVTLDPLLKALQAVPTAHVELLHYSGAFRGPELSQFLAQTNLVMDISRLEGNGAVGRVLGSAPGPNAGVVPVERILFGSHAPFFPLETALLKLMESPLDTHQLRAIMQGNARRFLSRA